MTPDDDQAIAELEKKGIEFIPVDIVKGELKEVKSRHARREREDSKRDSDDPVVKGMIIRNKKRKVKPGYKRKLDNEIKQHRRNEAKKTGRQQRRTERSNKKRK